MMDHEEGSQTLDQKSINVLSRSIFSELGSAPLGDDYDVHEKGEDSIDTETCGAHVESPLSVMKKRAGGVEKRPSTMMFVGPLHEAAYCTDQEDTQE